MSDVEKRNALYEAIRKNVNRSDHMHNCAACTARGRSIELARVVNIIEDLRDNDMTSGCYEACFDRVLDAIDPRPEQVAT